MHRSNNEITDKRIIEEILAGSDICRIAIMDAEYPYIVPFNYGYSDNALYFHSATKGKKLDLLRRNNKVCFEITYSSEIVKGEISCDWSTKYRSVIGYGTIEIISDLQEMEKGLDIIMNHYGKTENNTYNAKSIKKMFILKLSIESMTGKQLGDWDENPV